MTESVPRRRRWIFAALAAVVLAVLALSVSYLGSARFQERMRLKLVAELERVTGGRVELKSFDWKLLNLQFEARDLTIHGLESPEQTPYLHADRLLVRLKILSWFRHQLGIRDLQLDHPAFHILVY